MMKSRLRYNYKIARITLRLHWKLIRLHIAGWLTKLAFKISPDFYKEMRRQFGYVGYANTGYRRQDV